jgi:hypothetical protein
MRGHLLYPLLLLPGGHDLLMQIGSYFLLLPADEIFGWQLAECDGLSLLPVPARLALR